jgi:hypothetical protein
MPNDLAKKLFIKSKNRTDFSFDSNNIVNTGSVTSTYTSTLNSDIPNDLIIEMIKETEKECENISLNLVYDLVKQFIGGNNLITNNPQLENMYKMNMIPMDTTTSTTSGSSSCSTSSSSTTTISGQSFTNEGFYYNSYLQLLENTTGGLVDCSGLEWTYGQTINYTVTNGIVPCKYGNIYSESISTLMLLAVLYNDQETFNSLSNVVQQGILMFMEIASDPGSYYLPYPVPNNDVYLFPWSLYSSELASDGYSPGTLYTFSYNNLPPDASGILQTNTSGDINIALAYIFADICWGSSTYSYSTYATQIIGALRTYILDPTYYVFYNSYDDSINKKGLASTNYNIDYIDFTSLLLFPLYDLSGYSTIWQKAFNNMFNLYVSIYNIGDKRYPTGIISGYVNTIPYYTNPCMSYINLSNGKYSHVFDLESDPNNSIENYKLINIKRENFTYGCNDPYYYDPSGNGYGIDMFRMPIRIMYLVNLTTDISGVSILNTIITDTLQSSIASKGYSYLQYIGLDLFNSLSYSYTYAPDGSYNSLTNTISIYSPYTQSLQSPSDTFTIQNYVAAGLYSICDASFINFSNSINTTNSILNISTNLYNKFPDISGNEKTIDMEYNTEDLTNAIYTVWGLTSSTNTNPLSKTTNMNTIYNFIYDNIYTT